MLPQAEAAAASSLASYRPGSVDFMTVIENRMVVNRYREEVVTLTAAEGRAWADLEMLISHSLPRQRGLDNGEQFRAYRASAGVGAHSSIRGSRRVVVYAARCRATDCR